MIQNKLIEEASLDFASQETPGTHSLTEQPLCLPGRAQSYINQAQAANQK